MITRVAIVDKPRRVSPTVNCVILVTKCTTHSKKPSGLPGRPNRFFSCDTAIVTAAAEVNPHVTGMEMNSTRNPGRQRFHFTDIKAADIQSPR